GCAAAALAGGLLRRVVGALVDAVGGAVGVAIGFGFAAAALAGRFLGGVARAAVATVCNAVAVAVGIGDAAAALARLALLRVIGALVDARHALASDALARRAGDAVEHARPRVVRSARPLENDAAVRAVAAHHAVAVGGAARVWRAHVGEALLL